ncbi:MAG: IS110 family transposase, partial [Methylocystaceae bacterium]|nr:IS110 family transposase [Methylocystaceae bacterium]
MDKNTMIGVDLAKNIFQLHISTMAGVVLSKKKLSRDRFKEFMKSHELALVVLEACGSAHYWAETLSEMGHNVKLIAPQYVKPFIKRQKNDAADAEAIVVAAQRPEMRFVATKTKEQRAKAVVFRSRERLVHHRTEQVNALRAVLYEHGYVIPQGIASISRVEDILGRQTYDLPDLVCYECRDLLEQIAVTTKPINSKTDQIKQLAKQTDRARELQTITGIGPITAMALHVFAAPMKVFKNGRALSAWLGLVPRQYSSGGKERLGRVSKAGQTDIRRLLIIGAMSRLNWLGRKSIPHGSWLARMLARKPKMLVAIALANKMARMIWAMLTKGTDYRDPV